MIHLSRTMMLVVFATLSADKCMVLHNPIVDRMLKLSTMEDTSMLLSTLACNMVIGMEVVQKMYLEKVLMHDMMVYNVVLVLKKRGLVKTPENMKHTNRKVVHPLVPHVGLELMMTRDIYSQPKIHVGSSWPPTTMLSTSFLLW
ncbi:hypothetical protein J1N35_029062 [Gossypium stocksii]|uniref:Secreted protein n=1 Tax=Gossypium stocksii TaxID=47602 RepID=A0A9D3ZT61_9ROSI|nr:hypothetical protein J1N35_029062 [Gossypium stocksii]